MAAYWQSCRSGSVLWMLFYSVSSLSISFAQESAPTVLSAPAAAPVPSPTVAPVPQATAATIFPIPSYLTRSSEASNAVVEWNTAVQWSLQQSNATNLAPRLFAFVHLAIWQALKANNESSEPATATAVASYAGQLTMKNLVPLHFDKYNALLEQQTAGLSDNDLEAAEAVAAPVVVKLLSSRLDDGFQLPSPIPPTSGPPGQFLDTGTGKSLPVMQYGFTKPLLLPDDLSTVGFIANCTPPPDICSMANSIQYTSTYLYGPTNSDVRSLDQTNTAIFWADGGPGTSSSQGQWNRLVLGTLPSNLSIQATAEIMAKFNVGLYDSTVATFYLKLLFDRWRPVTAIRNGDPDHQPQPLWTPLLSTPNSPTYPSLGAAYAGFAEAVLNNFYGRDSVTFVVGSENRGLGGVLLPNRVYLSFTQVGSEVTQSRYFGGTEFPVDGITGRDLGGEIARYVLDNFESLDFT